MGTMKYETLETYVTILKEREEVVEAHLGGQENQTVSYVTYNSKQVKEQTVFVCKGANFKVAYLEEAVKRGAIAYVSEIKYDLPVEIPYILVKDIRKTMPLLAKLYFQSPWEDLHVVGIGGTKGKSTSVYYLKAIFDDYMEAQGKKESAVISSIDIYDGVVQKESHLTTPEALELQEHIRNAVESGIDFLEMEVSSQALKYGRVDEMQFDVAAFLNISEDHISPMEHKDFEDYFASKLLIFEKTKIAVINKDADEVDRILKAASVCEKVVTFSTKDKTADFYADQISKKGHHTVFTVHSAHWDQEFELTMPGLFNVENALAVIAIASQFDIPVQYMVSGLRRARSSGRMELFTSKDNQIVAVVDYAHNKLSFEKLFSSMKEEYPDREIYSIFGCPGKKALLRRRDLSMIAGQYAKKVYITAEDPGAEPVEEISKEIATYLEEMHCPYEMIENRGEAIRTAMARVEKPSVLLITGKGNEKRQKYGTEYIDCPSDIDYVKEYLAAYDQKVESAM